MNIQIIKKALETYDLNKIEAYAEYLLKLLNAKDKHKKLKNPWMAYRTDDELISYYKKVSLDGLDLDGVHVTLQSTGISYDYIAYKNRMLLVYPETLFDVSLVYKNDKFKFSKQSGKVIYQHEISNPFDQRQEDIIGGYCIIINKRGEFITSLSASQIEKHRKIARTDTIWKSWFHEMCLKTIIKKAVKIHFADIYQHIETIDNENYDLEQPLGISIEDKTAIEGIKTIEALKKYWEKNQGRNAGVLKDFNKLITNRKEQIEAALEKQLPNDLQSDKDDSQRQPGEEG